ncbi:CDP-alcohol phosphatidyltransferase family protein [Ferruginivarius sediminum]|uniref:CDP-diacylglycerol--glycerol-3-phosphate 3-phosphatidyltransferase n=1 Tax=Ferruginivarius sediminum TaxID=2661937 RepID=A0A369TBZ4_9PROT|nr:CDP-alcohol phosphatidyltransferase family protein [Ferruginivarius sediminum]RDD62800.1 CDP-alcohol phosphatidyltransferase family protein [Ferruginivarius sediminum]
MTGLGARYWLPTGVTLIRILAVPVMVYLILESRYTPAFWLLVGAGISDALDGFLAKRLNAVSRVGSYLDPMADKALIVAVFLSLGHMGQVPVWLVILVVFRDALIVAGAMLYHTLTQALRVEPLKISKANTAAQIVLVGLVLAKLGLGLAIADVTVVATYIVAATTFASGAAYVWTWGRRIFALEDSE